MFANDDLVLDENYLKDFENFNTSFDEDDRTDLKKRKIDSNKSVTTNTLNSLNNGNDLEIDSQSKVTAKDKINKKNKVLALFNKSTDEVTEIGAESQVSVTDKEKELQAKKSLQLSNRRQRVADLFKKASANITNTQDIEPNTTKHFSAKKLINQKNPSSANHNSTSSRHNKNVFEPKPGTSKDGEQWITQAQDKLFKEHISTSTPKVQSYRKPETPKLSDKKKNVLDCFKKYSYTTVPKQVFIRKFPGPAGLLPGESNNSILMDTTDNDNVSDDSTEKDDNSNICSQRTKNLFTEGAWQLMLKDLPTDLLKSYDIASIKRKIKFKKLTKNKVPFMAGIVKSIDYDSNNPRIVLKDLSGEIECCLHHKITNKFPNVLDYGIVILMKDVGIITSKTYLYGVVSLNNLISIYTSSERIVTTPNLNLIQTMESVDDSNHYFENNEATDGKVSSTVSKTQDNNRQQKQISKTNESVDDIDSLELFDDFFENEMDFDKENENAKELNVHNLSSNSDLNSSLNTKVIEQNSKQLQHSSKNENDSLISSKTSNKSNISEFRPNKKNELANFFDMEDEAFFTVDEDISQVDQSFFSSTPSSHKIESLKHSKKVVCQNENELELKETTKVDFIKYACHKKVSSAVNTNIKDNSLSSKSIEKSDTKIAQDDSKIKDVSETKNEVNINSAKFKLMKFKRRSDEILPETKKSPIVTTTQSAFNDNLFSCDDDLLMSQMDLSYLET